MRIHALNHVSLVLLGSILLALPSPAISKPKGETLSFEPYRFRTRDGQEFDAEFGRLRVPENRSRPNGRVIELALVRFPRTGEDSGFPFVYLAGGPGGSGIELARGPRAPLFQSLRAYGDVIALDQRGAGSSHPNLECGEDLNFPLDQPGDQDAMLERYRALAEECSRSLKGRGVDLSAYNTRESADDLESLRRGLGVAKLRLVAMSYGTHLALSVIRRHGDRIDRAILAGVEGPDHTLKLPRQIETQLDRVSSLLAEDPEVGEAIPDFRSLVTSLLDRLEAQPISIVLDKEKGDSVVIGAFDLKRFTAAAICRRDTIRLLPSFYLPMLSGDYSSLGSILVNSRQSSLSAMAGAVDCASSVSDERWNRIQGEAPKTLLGRCIDFPFPEISSSWAVPRLPDEFRSPVKSEVPVLFVSGTLDGRTPPSNAEEVSRGFPNHEHLLVEGMGHEDGLLVGSDEILQQMGRFARGEKLSMTRISFPPIRFSMPQTPTELASADPARSSGSLAIENTTVIDGTDAGEQTGMTVIIEGTKIVAVKPAPEVELPPMVTRIDGTGKFLIPGLWDLHVHASKIRGSSLPLFVAHGVTSVRDMGSELAEVRRWQQEIAEQKRVGPRILTPGPYLEAASNVERMIREGTVEPVERARIGIRNPKEAAKVVAEVAAMGVDYLKIRTFQDLETYHAVGAAAKKAGLPLVGHAFGLTPEDLLKSGQRCVEHGLYPTLNDRTDDERREICESFAKAGIAFVPTLSAFHRSILVSDELVSAVLDDVHGKIAEQRKYVSAYLLEDWKEQVEERTPERKAAFSQLVELLTDDFRTMHRAGVQILPGSDVAVLLIYPGASLHEELELFVQELGMTPEEALISATRKPAEFLGLSESLGTIEPGKTADLVLLDKNPLEDIRHTRAIHGVIRNGIHYDRKGIERLFQTVLASPELRENDWK